MFDGIVEAKVFHCAKDFSLIAKIIIKTNIENIYTSQPYDFVFKMRSVYCLSDILYIAFYYMCFYILSALILTYVYLIFCGSELY